MADVIGPRGSRKRRGLRAFSSISVVLLLCVPKAARSQGDDAKPVDPDEGAAPADGAPADDAGAAANDSAASTPPGLGAGSVTVAGDPLSRTGSKLRVPLRDVPATVNVVDRRTLEEQGVSDLAGAFHNIAGANAVLTYGGFHEISLRGFNDFVVLRDGIRDDRSTIAQSAPWTNLADVERIEVLKGPASVLYGFGGVGGVINIVRKKPSPTLTYDASMSVGGPKFFRRTTLGAGGPLGTEMLTYRVDAGMSKDTDFRGTEIERNSFTGALELRPGHGHKLLVRLNASRDLYNTDAGIPTVDGAIPAGIDRTRRFNTPQDYMRYHWYEAQAEYSYRASDSVEIIERLSYVVNPYLYFSSENLAATNHQTVERSYLFFGHDWRPLYNQLELALTGTVLVPHRALVGFEAGLLRSTHPRSSQDDTSLLPTTFASQPDPQAQVTIVADRTRVLNQNTQSIYVHDIASLLPDLKLVVGARGDAWHRKTRIDVVNPANRDVTQIGDETTRSASAFTFRAGLVYQPLSWLTGYLSYATAFVPVSVVPADNRQLDPERGKQAEVGVRFEAPEQHVHVNIAAFNIAKTDVVVSRPMDEYDQAGRLDSSGLEVDADLLDLSGFSARLGYAYTHARYDHYASDSGADYSGKKPQFVPDQMVTGWGTYRHESGLGIGLGGRVLGVSYGDLANNVPLPAFGVVDAALFYRVKPFELALNVTNVLDNQKYLLGAINDTQVHPGPPRVFMGTLRIAE